MMGKKTSLALLAVTLLMAERGFPQVVEDLLESSDEIPESSEFTEQLDRLMSDPVNLNSADRDELLRLPWLTPLMAEEIVRYRGTHGSIEHLSELDTLSGFDPSLTARMASFVVLPAGKAKEKALAVTSRHRFISSDQTVSDCPGERSKVYSRIGISFPDGYSIGFLAEKDACEQNYADYLSAYLLFNGGQHVSRIIVGHYYLEFGEGLTFAPAGFSVKSQGVIKKGNRGILASKSSDENRSLFGSAVNLALGRSAFSAFVSCRRLDANLYEDGSVRSLYESGLHRTATEQRKKDVLTERLTGGRVELMTRGGSCGLTFSHAVYSRPFHSAHFTGQECGILALDVERPFKQAKGFGEVAVSTAGGMAGLIGLRYSTGPFSTGLLARRFDADFWSPHSSYFSEYGGQNEEGTYCHVRFRATESITVEAYMDLFKTIQPAEPEEYCDRGNEFGMVLLGKMARTVKSQVKYRRKLKRGNVRESLRAQLDATAGILRARIRAEFSAALDAETSEKSNGDLGYLGLIASPNDWLELEGRFIAFSTGSYDARIYVYERDLPGYVRNVALHGAGTRYYVLCRCLPATWLELTAKYSHQQRDEIREEFGFQVDLLGSF